MRGKIAWLKSPVRHRTLAPFGSITRIRFKGSSNWTSQPSRLPRCVELRIRPDPVKSTQHTVCTSARQERPERDTCEQTVRQNLSSSRRLLHVRVENGKPLTVLQFPDRPGVVIAGGVLTIHGALNLHLISR